MKALNRAIARTTGHIIKLCAFRIDGIGTQGCAVKQTPETLKQLEQHLAALLDIEREQLAVAGIKSGHIIPGIEVVVPPVKWTPEMVAAFNRMEPVQLLPHEHGVEGDTTSALDKACEAASNFASEGARYLQQRDEALAALKDTLDSLEYVEKHMPGMTGFMVRQERIARAKTVIANIKGSAASDKPVQWYQHGVWSAFDPNLQQTPSAASEQPVPPMPDVIDMTDSRNWQVGDVLRCSDSNAFLGFNDGDECAVAGKSETYVTVRRNSGTAVTLHHDKTPASNFFTWLRHGESQQ